MSANRELDHLLEQLRLAAAPCAALDDIESRVWQKIAVSEAMSQRPKLGLSVLLASVAAAFMWGIFDGMDVARSYPTAQTLLVEEVDILPPDFGNPLP
jgi:hypothetical protein